jgi:thiol-disulfide isomerase/thioredoxin
MIKRKINWSLIFILMFVLGFIIIFTQKQKIDNYLSKLSYQNSSLKINSKTDSLHNLFNYETKGLTYRYTFLEFGAVGCSSCRHMEPILAAIRKEYPSKINVIFHNLLTEQGLIHSKAFGVLMIPTQVILNRKGIEIFRHTGTIEKDELLNIMK